VSTAIGAAIRAETIYDRWSVKIVLATMALTLLACTGAPDDGSTEHLLVLGSAGEIFIIDPTGRKQTDLAVAAEGSVHLQPTWSPNGTRAVWTEIGKGGPTIGLWDGERVQNVTAPLSPFFYLWNPPADRVAFLGDAASGSGIRLGLLDPSGRTASEIDAGQPYYLDWSPAGDQLVTHVAAERLSLLDQSGAATPIDITPGSFLAPDWTELGVLAVGTRATDRVAATGTVSGVQTAARQSSDHLLLFDPISRTTTELSPVDGPVAFAVSPDRAHIAFTSEVGAVQAVLRVIGAQGGEPVQIGEVPAVAFQWSPDSRRLWYLTVDLEAQRLVPRVWEEGRIFDFPGFAPTTAFIRDYLPFWDQYSRSLTVWSADSTRFVYPAAGANGDEIFVQTVAPEAGPLRVTAGAFASWQPQP
jgi:TolB protein